MRAIAAKFDKTIQDNAEKVIARDQPLVDDVIARYKSRLEGKPVMLWVGGLRPRPVRRRCGSAGAPCRATAGGPDALTALVDDSQDIIRETARDPRAKLMESA